MKMKHTPLLYCTVLIIAAVLHTLLCWHFILLFNYIIEYILYFLHIIMVL